MSPPVTQSSSSSSPCSGLGLGWTIETGDSPVIAVALHQGHQIRDELLPWLNLHAGGRLREEDPFTGDWTAVTPTRVLCWKSRFEVDLNRPRDKAVYQTPEDAWGLAVWRTQLPNGVVERSLDLYDAFYRDIGRLLRAQVRKHGRVVVLDLHSYNYRRGIDREPADPEHNPQVNVGTGTMVRRRWANVVDRFIGDLSSCSVAGRALDVRENVRFFGGQFPAWVHGQFPNSVCVLAVEFKKFFMDEWTGDPLPDVIEQIGKALGATIPGLVDELSSARAFAVSDSEA